MLTTAFSGRRGCEVYKVFFWATTLLQFVLSGLTESDQPQIRRPEKAAVS
jgi:hypothetical protein